MNGPEREIRPTTTGTNADLANSTNSSVQPKDATTSEPVALIGATVEKSLAMTLIKLQSDLIGLDDLTPALAGFFLAGHEAALRTVLPELTRTEQDRDQANADADRLHNRMYNPRPPIDANRPSYSDLQRIRAEIHSGGAK